MKRFIWIISLLVLAISLAACSAKTPTSMPVVGTAAPAGVSETSVPPASSTELQISLKNFAFNPDTVTVKVGTTVKWTNEDNVIHTVTSDTNLFDSGDMNQGDTFSFTFTQAGTYPYYCIPHHANMKGTVIVTE